jgi:hypothetical protein
MKRKEIMALQITLRNAHNLDTIHAVARMNAKTYQALKEFMHSTDEIAIRFPHGVGLFKRGRGWYRLEPKNAYRANEALAFAMKLIRRFLIDAERAVAEEIKRFTPIMLNPGMKVATFSNAHSEGEFGYIGRAVPPERTPIPQHKLNALVAKFKRPQHKV